VLIVGAGLAGATAAFELSRMGVAARIVDERPAPAAARDTLTLHTRTLDLLERRGLDPRTLNGNLIGDAAVYWKRKLIGSVPLAQAAGTHREFLLANRAVVERTMRELLDAHGVTAEYSTTLVALCDGASSPPDPPNPPDPPDQGVRAILRHGDGRLEEVRAPYLVSADGTQGALRHVLRPPTAIRRAGHSFLLADIQADGDLPADQVCVFLGRHGYLAVFPLGGHRFRCVATEPQLAAGLRGAPSIDDLQQIVDAASPAPPRLREVSWSCRIPASGRPAAPVLRRGRVFFGGESACAYPATSAHGANLGIQDMINLSWKLAMVLRGQAAPDLLDTYGAERQGIIREVSRRAGLAADMLGAPSTTARHLVARAGPVFLDARFALWLGADLVGEVPSDYRCGPLSASCLGPGDLRSGDEVPDLPVLACDADAPPGTRPRETRLHELVDPSHLTLLFTAATQTAETPPAWPQLGPWQPLVHAHRIVPIRDQPDERSQFTAIFGGHGMFVVRPDLYVGFAGQQRGTRRLAAWLARWFPASADTIPVGPRAA
jgi:2-polyprenyl-6-methoxyphenol hydroxylase-like FAD-dependent oxidoreductase